MHCLIVDTQPKRLEDSMIAFLDAGLQVTGTGGLRVADTCLRRTLIDVLLIDLGSAQGDHTRLICMAEALNPRLVTLIVTPDVALDFDALTKTYPSVHGVISEGVAPQLTAKLALASLGETLATSGCSADAFAPRLFPMAAPVFHSARAEARAA